MLCLALSSSCVQLGYRSRKEQELEESFAPVDGTGSKHLGGKCV